MGLTIPNMSHETGGPKSEHQEPRGSTSDCLTLTPKEICPEPNHQEPGGSTSDHLKLVLKKIRHTCTHNNSEEPFINNKNKTDITKKCNGLHQTYADITKICRHQNAMQTFCKQFNNRNMTLISLLT